MRLYYDEFMLTRPALLIFMIGIANSCFSNDKTETWIEPATGMSFVLIHAGEFTMGSPAQEPGRDINEIAHTVHLSKDFYLGRYEITQVEWKTVMGANPSWFQSCGSDCPVERVSWNDVNVFIARLNRRTSGGFRLPTEAEWEYACRAGTTTTFSTGASLNTGQANFDGRFPYNNDAAGVFRGAPIAVGSFEPNAWGIYDMHGNVWEWTSDPYCPYEKRFVTDPKPVCKSPLRVIRGGSWYFGADSARCALRYTHRPQDSGFSLGFRLARTIQ